MKEKNNFVTPLLTDLYELTMAYAYWKSGRYEDRAVFEIFFRKNPFGGEFTIFAGLEEVLNFVSRFHYTEEDIDYVCSLLPDAGKGFREWLKGIDCSQIRIYAVKEGTIVFPLIPLIRIEGPLAVTQLLETALLNLINYPSLVATNAARMRLAAGKEKRLLEFGLRRAQGPDGGVTASRYSYLGGFDATSNVLAAQLYGIPVRGTHAHAFVSTFSTLDEISDPTIKDEKGREHNFVQLVLQYRDKLGAVQSNSGELAAFVAYAQAFPRGFLALVDTYDTLRSGIPNFLCVALALNSIGYRPLGIRLDSGDLAYLSKRAREMFREVSKRYNVQFQDLSIVASNDIDETTLYSLMQQGHQIDVFGIGTHLVTCQNQPALGGVYKLVEVNGTPKIKLSQDIGKITIPGRKEAYRLIGQEGFPLLDVMIQAGEKPPKAGSNVLCRHPFEEVKRISVKPSDVIPLHECVWNGKSATASPSLQNRREYVFKQLNSFRRDHLRPVNPTPYKVSVSEQLYDFIHKLWMREAPIAEIK